MSTCVLIEKDVRSKRWFVSLVDELNKIKVTYRENVLNILKNYAKQLGNLSDDTIKNLIDVAFVGLADSTEVWKAVWLGRGNIEELLYNNKALTANKIAQLPEKDKKLLSDPKATIPILIYNRVENVSTIEISESPKLTRQIINSARPDLGILHPNDQLKKKYVSTPDYHSFVRVETDEHPDSILIVFKMESGNEYIRTPKESKIRIYKKDAKRQIQKLMESLDALED